MPALAVVCFPGTTVAVGKEEWRAAGACFLVKQELNRLQELLHLVMIVSEQPQTGRLNRFMADELNIHAVIS